MMDEHEHILGSGIEGDSSNDEEWMQSPLNNPGSDYQGQPSFAHMHDYDLAPDNMPLSQSDPGQFGTQPSFAHMDAHYLVPDNMPLSQSDLGQFGIHPLQINSNTFGNHGSFENLYQPSPASVLGTEPGPSATGGYAGLTQSQSQAPGNIQPTPPSEGPFCCPFFAQDPVAWDCPGMNRFCDIRQHIKRCHMHPICPSCGRKFAIEGASKNLDNLGEAEAKFNRHVQEQSCIRRKPAPPPYVEFRQLLEMRNIKQSSNKEDQKAWNKMWGIIFPYFKPPASAYINVSKRFMWFVESSKRALVTNNLISEDYWAFLVQAVKQVETSKSQTQRQKQPRTASPTPLLHAENTFAREPSFEPSDSPSIVFREDYRPSI